MQTGNVTVLLEYNINYLTALLEYIDFERVCCLAYPYSKISN